MGDENLSLTKRGCYYFILSAAVQRCYNRVRRLTCLFDKLLIVNRLLFQSLFLNTTKKVENIFFSILVAVIVKGRFLFAMQHFL